VWTVIEFSSIAAETKSTTAVTSASVDYEGSLTISADLAILVGLFPYEKILVANMANGERFETYVIYGAANKGIIELNGATAHMGKLGDRLTIMSFVRLKPEEAHTHRPRVALLDDKNSVVRCEGSSCPGLIRPRRTTDERDFLHRHLHGDGAGVNGHADDRVDT